MSTRRVSSSSSRCADTTPPESQAAESGVVATTEPQDHLESLSFHCPGCGEGLSLPIEFAGAEGPCPYCESEIRGPQYPGEPAVLLSAPIPTTTITTELVLPDSQPYSLAGADDSFWQFQQAEAEIANRLDALRNEEAQARRATLQAQNECETATEEAAQMLRRRETLAREVSGLELLRKEARNDLEGIKEEISNLSVQCGAVRREYLEHQGVFDSLAEKLAARNQELARVNADIEVAREFLDVSEAEDARLGVECEKARQFIAENTYLEEQIALRKQDLESVTAELETRAASLQQRREEETALIAKCEVLKLKLAEDTATAENLARQIYGRKAEFEALTRGMEMAKSNLAQTRTEEAELSTKCENARKFLTENAKIEAELTSRKSELNAVTKEIETKKLDLGNLRSEQQLLTTKLEALRRNFEESSGKTQHQDKEIAARQKKLDQLRDEIDTANILLEQRRVEESELTEKCGSSWQNLADKWKRGAGLTRRKKT